MKTVNRKLQIRKSLRRERQFSIFNLQFTICNPSRPKAPPGIAGAILIGLVLLSLSGCAGYQIGNQSLYPRHVRTVHVPVFESNSYRRNLGERLTEAVCKEIELKTDYKVTGDPNADTVLVGRIVSDRKRPTVVARSGDARELQTSLRVSVDWIDRQGNAVRPSGSVPLPSAVIVNSAANLVPEVGQSVATSHQQAIHRTAEQIVALMEAPW